MQINVHVFKMSSSACVHPLNCACHWSLDAKRLAATVTIHWCHKPLVDQMLHYMIL